MRIASSYVTLQIKVPLLPQIVGFNLIKIQQSGVFTGRPFLKLPQFAGFTIASPVCYFPMRFSTVNWGSFYSLEDSELLPQFVTFLYIFSTANWGSLEEGTGNSFDVWNGGYPPNS